MFENKGNENPPPTLTCYKFRKDGKGRERERERGGLLKNKFECKCRRGIIIALHLYLFVSGRLLFLL